MNFEWNELNAIVFFSWLATSSVAGLPVVLLSGLVLFSNSIPMNLLLLLTLTLVSFITAAKSAQKEFSSITQKYYVIRFLGILTALLGSIIYPPMMMFGLLITLPIFIWSLLFDRHYESMTVRAYLYSTVLPALVSLIVLERIKPLVKADFQQVWDIGFTLVGLITMITGSILAFLKKKTKSLVIYLTHSWIGLAIFLLMIDAGAAGKLALSALFCFALTGPLLMVAGKQLGERAETFSRVMLLGMPGFLSFLTIFYSIRSIASLNVHWMWVVIVAFLFQVLAMMVNGYETGLAHDPKNNREGWLRFALIIAVQFICSASLYWLDHSGAL